MRRFALVLLLLVAACASPLPPPYVPGAGTPVLEAGAFVASDGARLPLRAWVPDDGNPRAVIVGVHGMNDYGNAFAMPGAWFAERGVAVYAYDQRGFGEAPLRGRWAGTSAMTADLGGFADAVRARHPGVPAFVLGLSMGGAVVLASADDGGLPAVDGVMLVSPAVWGWRAMNPFYKLTLWLTAHVWPSKTLTGSRLEIWPSDNIEMLRAYSRDPLVLKATRVDTIYGLVTLMDEGYGGAGALAGPTLVLYGDKDEIVPRKPVEDVAGRLGGEARFVTYANGYHMLLRDLQRETVWRDMLAWMEDPAAPMPSIAGAAPPVAQEHAAGVAAKSAEKKVRKAAN